MVSSLLTDTLVKKIYTDRLFFDRYQYGLNFKLAGVTSLRNNLRIVDDDEAREAVINRFDNQLRYINTGGSWQLQKSQRPGRIEELLELSQCLRRYRNLVHVLVSHNWCYVYSNDTAVIADLQQLPFIECVSVREAVINRPRDSVLLMESSYSHRSYFRECLLNEKEKTSLCMFLKNQKEIRLCPSLNQMINPDLDTTQGRLFRIDGVRLARHHFFDHNNTAVALMLQLISPGLVRKTARILTK